MSERPTGGVLGPASPVQCCDREVIYMTNCREAGGTPMDSTVGRGEAMGVPPASLRHMSLDGHYDQIQSCADGSLLRKILC